MSFFTKLKDKVSKILEKIFKSKNAKDKDINIQAPPPPPPPPPPPSPPTPLPPPPSPPVVNKPKEHSEEPVETNPASQITSFLWKPVSDTSPHAVIVVGCDGIRTEHLKVLLIDAQGNIIPGRAGSNPGSKRSNKEAGHKFGRINFKPGKTCEQYKISQPITVKFYVEISGIKHNIKIQNQDHMVISDVTQRWKAINGQLVINKK